MNENKRLTLQDQFLSALKSRGDVVSIFLLTGIRLFGKIEAFDSFSIVLYNRTNQLIYKHAISTISPTELVDLELDD